MPLPKGRVIGQTGPPGPARITINDIFEPGCETRLFAWDNGIYRIDSFLKGSYMQLLLAHTT